MPSVQEKMRVDTRDKRKETTGYCRRHKYRSLSCELISRVVPREKRVSGDPLHLGRTGKRKQFLPDLP